MVRSNKENFIPSAHVDREEIMVRKVNLLQVTMSGATYLKLLDIINQATSFSCYKNGNVSTFTRAVTSLLIEGNINFSRFPG